MSDTWGNMLDSYEEKSWETILTEEERMGGPSPWGNSKYSVFEQCPYKYHVAFNKRMRSTQLSDALEIGGLFHEGKAHYYLKDVELRDTDISDKDLDTACTKAMYDLLDRAHKVTPRITSEVRRLLTGWMKIHGPGRPTDNRHETLLIEPLLEVNRGFEYSTRLDRVILSEKLGGPVIDETKTAGRKTEDLLASYTMDGQFLGQQYCWRHSPYYKEYGPLKGFIVDLTIKTAQMSSTREVVPLNEAAMRDWEKQKRYTYKQMVNCGLDNYWPKIRTNCVKYGPCNLRKHCGILGRGKNAFTGFRKKKKGEY